MDGCTCVSGMNLFNSSGIGFEYPLSNQPNAKLWMKIGSQVRKTTLFSLFGVWTKIALSSTVAHISQSDPKY